MTERKASRRAFLNYAVTAIVVGVVAGVGGYYAGLSISPAQVTTTTVTKPGTPVTTTVTQPPVTTTVTQPPVTTTVEPKPPRTIKIGGTVAATGHFGSLVGPQYIDWMKAWGEYVNERGGIFVKEYGQRLPVEMIIYDDASSEDKTAELYEKLCTVDKVDILAGPFASPMGIRAALVAEKNQVPIILIETNSMSAFDKGWHWSVGLDRVADLWGHVFVDYLEWLKGQGLAELQTAAVVSEDIPGASDPAIGTNDALRERGMNVLAFEMTQPGTTDYSAVIAKIRGLNPDVVYASFHDSAPFIKQAYELGLRPKEFYFSLLVTPQIRPLGQIANGLTCMTFIAPALLEKKYLELQRRIGITDPYAQPHLPLRYWAMEMMTRAIEEAGTLDKGKIMDALWGISFMSPNGFIFVYKDYKYKDKTLSGFGNWTMFQAQVVNSTPEVIFPEQFATTEYKPLKEAPGSLWK